MHIDKLCLSDFICAEISDYHPNGHFESNDKIQAGEKQLNILFTAATISSSTHASVLGGFSLFLLILELL